MSDKEEVRVVAGQYVISNPDAIFSFYESGDGVMVLLNTGNELFYNGVDIEVFMEMVAVAKSQQYTAMAEAFANVSRLIPFKMQVIEVDEEVEVN